MTPWLLVTAVGCGTGEGASYLVIDEPARAALVEVDVGGRTHGGALPLEIELGMPVDLLTPAGRRPLRTAPGLVYQVQGAGTVTAWALGQDVRTDQVDLTGAEPAVRNLASALGARPEPWNGRWRLRGPDVLLRLSWMGDVAEISDVQPVLTETARDAARTGWTERPAAAPAVPANPADAIRGDPWLAALVGQYTGDAPAGARAPDLFMDAEGNFWLHSGCDVRAVQGRYRKADGQLLLDGTNLALTIGEDGWLTAPGVVFTRGDEP